MDVGKEREQDAVSFEFTGNFLQSEIRTVIPLLQSSVPFWGEIPCESKALRDDVHGSTNAVEAGAENRHPAPW
jgi:hypothetical protein